MSTAYLNHLEIKHAIEKWNLLALKNTESLTIAHNPFLYYFFSGYLNMPSYYFILVHEDQPIGLLPLIKAGKNLVSIPHFSHGGVLWLTEPMAGIEEGQLLKSISSHLLNEKPDSGFYQYNFENFIEVKNETPIEVRKLKPVFGISETKKVMLLMPLKKSIEDQSVTFDSNLRRKINKARKNGIIVKQGGKELIGDFAKVYNRNMQNIGSPSLGENFFNQLFSTENSNAEVYVAYAQGKPIGGGFCMWYDGYFENIWFSTLHKYNKFYTSYLLHESMIRSAIEKGAKTYSFGRSTKNSGAHRYKLQWPVEERDLFFSKTVDSNFSLKDQKWISSIWKKLPGFFVDAVGPFFAKKMY